MPHFEVEAMQERDRLRDTLVLVRHTIDSLPRLYPNECAGKDAERAIKLIDEALS